VNGDPKRLSNGELVPGAERVMELSVEGVDAPDDCAVEAGVTVAARSRATNLPLSRGWSFQELDSASLLMTVEDEVICMKTLKARGDFGDDRPFNVECDDVGTV
jgi:hypothetical protein